MKLKARVSLEVADLWEARADGITFKFMVLVVADLLNVGLTMADYLWATRQNKAAVDELFSTLSSADWCYAANVTMVCA